MLMNHAAIAPARFPAMLHAAEAAARAIPPAFPLDATVAVNPFLGHTHEDLATAAARLGRVAGARITRSGGDYCDAIASGAISESDLAAALAAHPSPRKPADTAMLRHAAARIGNAPPPRALPTVADLAAEATGIDWPALIDKCIGLWAAGHFDRGQALWSPAPETEVFAAWRAWATHDLTPEIAGLDGFCAHVACAPDTAERAIVSAAETLGLTEASAPTALHRLAMSLGGWAQHARWLLWQAERVEGSDAALTDLIAIRMIWDEALLVRTPAIADRWAETLAAHALPVEPGPEDAVLAILQDAADRGHQRRLAALLDGAAAPAPSRPFLQAAFCIDVRSEVFRRALESVDGSIATIGFAGFFGLPLAHQPQGSDLCEARLPVLLNPVIETSGEGDPARDQAIRIAARAARAWGRFRQAAVSSFAFVEAAGPLYAAKLVQAALGLIRAPAPEPAPQFVTAMSAGAKADTAAAVLKAMSLTRDHGRIVLLLGHGGNVTNNPHESAYHCGACGGHRGEVSARLLAGLLNDPETRAGLASRGVELPRDTLFLAGLHDTTTDEVTIYDDGLPAARNDDMETLRTWLAQAGYLARAERALRLPGARGETLPVRARNWAAIRPEWGLAGCAAFIAAPRAATQGRDLEGRAFLHTYDWRADEGFATLELILTAPVVVASWIALQYYGSSVAPGTFGGGNKLIHNVVGGIGVIEGNGGVLRTGLPWQAVHDGAALAHEPLRLSVMIEAPREALLAVLERHPQVRALFDNGWLHLLALEGGKVAARYAGALEWEGVAATG